MKALVLFILVGLLLSGCFPYRYTNRPGVLGTVVNAHTRRPISGALVTLNDRLGRRISASTTARDGTFAIVPDYQWGIYIVPADVWELSYPLSITHSGFKTYTQDMRSHPMSRANKATKNVGVISLTPLR